MSAERVSGSQQDETTENAHKVLDAEPRYKVLDIETFHALERFKDALDDYKNSNANKLNCEDLRQDPATLSAIYSKAFGIEDRFASLNDEEKNTYQEKLIQAAGNAYALKKDRTMPIPDFSYDSPCSSKDNEILFFGNDLDYDSELQRGDTHHYDCGMSLSNFGISAEDARLGRGQKYSAFLSGTVNTNNVDWYNDYDKIAKTLGTCAARIVHDPEDHYAKHIAMFKADAIPIVHLSDNDDITLVGFAPDMSTIKGTDYSMDQYHSGNAYHINRILEENVNLWLRDGSYKNDMGLQAVREGRDVLSKMAVLPSNEDALPDFMNKSFERDAIARNKVLAYYDYNYFDSGCDTVYINSYELTETPEGKYHWSKYEAKADIADTENPYSVNRNMTEISKEQAMNIVSGAMSIKTGKSDSFTKYKCELTDDGKKLCDEFSDTYSTQETSTVLAGCRLTENDNVHSDKSAKLLKIADGVFRYDQYDTAVMSGYKCSAVDEHTAAEIIKQSMDNETDISHKPLNAFYVTDAGKTFYNEYSQRITERQSEKIAEKEIKELAVKFDDYRSGTHSWTNTRRLLEQDGNFSLKLYDGYTKKESVEPITKEEAENIISNARTLYTRTFNENHDWSLRAHGQDYYDRMQVAKAAEKAAEEPSIELARWCSKHESDIMELDSNVINWTDTHSLFEQGGKFSITTISDSPYGFATNTDRISSVDVTKEKAEEILNDIVANKIPGNTFLSKDGKAYYENMQVAKAAEKAVAEKPVEKSADTSAKRYYADFSKQSGNSRENVEMIAVIKPKHEYYKPDANGEKKLAAIYVDTQVNNSKLSQADAAAGNGQTNAHLFNECKNGKFNSSVPWSPSQVDKLKEICGTDTYTAKDGTMYIPLKADVMPMRRTVNGKQITVGYMPNTKTIQQSGYGPLTAKDVNKHFDNSKALSSSRFNKGAAISVETVQSAEKNKQTDEQFC